MLVKRLTFTVVELSFDVSVVGMFTYSGCVQTAILTSATIDVQACKSVGGDVGLAVV